MKRSGWIMAAVLVLSLSAACSREDPLLEGAFQVPRGFVAESVLPEAQKDSLIQIAFDSLGRPVVSKERGHPTILLDNDGDGVFETEKIFSDKVQSLQGMWFEGRALYAIGFDTENRETGLYRAEDTDGDDVADNVEQLHLFTGPMQEHGPHDIRRTPDGALSIMIGNHSHVPAEMIDPLSPLRGLREWQLLERYMDARGHASGILAPGGAVFRLDRDTMQYSIVAAGFRNAYNHAYNNEGEIFVVAASPQIPAKISLRGSSMPRGS